MSAWRTTWRRGAAGVATVIVLVFAQLMVVGAVVVGTRDQDQTIMRLDSTRSFYAAESGANMAVRESMRGVDEDSDGSIGTISSDGNANNDPALGNARFTVVRTLVSGATQLVSTGRCGVTRRKADARVSGVIGGVTQTVMVGFGRAGNNQPRYSVWSGSAWGASAAAPNIGGEAKWVRMKICPTRNETSMIVEDTAQRVSVLFFNGSTWSSPYLVSTDTGGTNDRPEDVGYEQLSSDALCVYWKGTSSLFGYRVYNGTTFAAEQTLSSPFTTEADFVTLYPRPSSDEMMLVAADGIAGGKLVASVWNGSSFGAWTTLETTLESNNEECYSLAFESQTGKAVAVYTESGVATPRYRTWNGSTWSSEGSLPTIGGVAQWIRLAADPTSNQILFVALDSSNDINANIWNGSSWGTNVELETNVPNSDRRQFDVIYERGTGKALLVYSENGVNTPRYRTWSGSAWSAEASGPNLGAGVQIISLSRGFGNGEVFIAASDSNMDLHLQRWSGSAMSTDTVIETNLSGWVNYYSFAVPEPTVAPHPKVVSWAEVTP